MSHQEQTHYYLSRKDELPSGFAALIPEIPYVDGDENHLTASLIGSARCLALYQAIDERGKSAAETGRVLYYAIEASPPPAPIPPAERLSRWASMDRRHSSNQIWSRQADWRPR
jgi:hypothetical protein